jgi:hypothetical protein
MLKRGAFVLFVCLWACGGSEGPITEPAPPEPALSMNPTANSVTAGGAAVTFAATLANSSEAIEWSLNGKGSLSASSGAAISYTPPGSLIVGDTATVIATAAGETAFATITINPNVTLTATPVTRTVKAGSPGVTFTASLQGSDATILWALLKGQGSWTPIGATSTYFPPATVTATETATLTAFAEGLTADVVITITP